MTTSLTLTRPDDWHVHLRDGDVLADTVRDISRCFGRAICMPNLVPPVVTTEDALAYRDRILAVRPAGAVFSPLMTLYLTDRTDPAEIARARAAGVVAAKLYPAGATTNSDSGVTDIDRMGDVFIAMAEQGMLLLLHGEVTDASVDIFDRETVFVERLLAPLIQGYPRLKVVLEHITTKAAADFVSHGPETLAATITAHHLRLNRNDMLVGGIRPHHYCLPILKRERDRQALIAAATGGNPRFFLGTDSAPHARHRKESGCGCAGSYTGHAAIELYAEVFEAAGALARLEAFASHHGADFYGLPRNTDTITLERHSWRVAETLRFGPDVLVPHGAGDTLAWRVSPVVLAPP